MIKLRRKLARALLPSMSRALDISLQVTRQCRVCLTGYVVIPVRVAAVREESRILLSFR